MSFIETLKKRTTEIAQKAQDVAKVFMVTEEVALKRIDICNSCEHLFPITRNCKKCGCFVDAKSKLIKSKCPVGKW